MPVLTLEPRPLSKLRILAYTKRGLQAPTWQADTFPVGAHLAALVPTRMRRFHHLYAVTHGFFWIPCPRCGVEFGGHEISTQAIDVGVRHRIVCTACSSEMES